MAHNSPVDEDEGGATANGQGPRSVPDFGIPDSFGQIPAVTVEPAAPAAPVAPVATPVSAPPTGPVSGPATPPPPAAPPTQAASPTGAPVTDEDRQTYGRLLDSAFERGLLGSYDYEVRLRELSEAASIEEMKKIVTELPVFALPTAGAKAKRSSLSGTPTVGGTGAKSPWMKLVILVVAVVIAFVLLALYAEHIVHNRTGGTSGAPAAVVAVSPLRL